MGGDNTLEDAYCHEEEIVEVRDSLHAYRYSKPIPYQVVDHVRKSTSVLRQNKSLQRVRNSLS